MLYFILFYVLLNTMQLNNVLFANFIYLHCNY